jgi:hypothetical protein
VGIDVWSFFPFWRHDPTIPPERWARFEAQFLDKHSACMEPWRDALNIASSDFHYLLGLIALYSQDARGPGYPICFALRQRLHEPPYDAVLLPEHVGAFVSELRRFKSDAARFRFSEILPEAPSGDGFDPRDSRSHYRPTLLRTDLWMSWSGGDEKTTWYLVNDGSEIFVLQEPATQPSRVHTPISGRWPEDGSLPRIVAKFRRLLVVPEKGEFVDADSGERFRIEAYGAAHSHASVKFGAPHKHGVYYDEAIGMCIITFPTWEGPASLHSFPLLPYIEDLLDEFIDFASTAEADGCLILFQ